MDTIVYVSLTYLEECSQGPGPGAVMFDLIRRIRGLLGNEGTGAANMTRLEQEAPGEEEKMDGQWVNCESVEVLSPLGVLATYINPPLSAENGANGEGNSAAACKPHYG